MADATGRLPITVVITLTGQEPGNEHTSTPQRVRRKLRKEKQRRKRSIPPRGLPRWTTVLSSRSPC